MISKENCFVGYEYLEIPVKRQMESLYVDSYENFGWNFEGDSPREGRSDEVTLQFMRDRKLRSKTELTRLQRQFESCVREIEALERSRAAAASIAAFSIGLAGTALLGCAVSAYLHGLLFPAALLAVPGFLGWMLPYFCYQKLRRKRERQIAPLIEQKSEEICRVCEQGCRLLNA